MNITKKINKRRRTIFKKSSKLIKISQKYVKLMVKIMIETKKKRMTFSKVILRKFS